MHYLFFWPRKLLWQAIPFSSWL